MALRWDDVDLDAKSLRVRATRLRPVYEHGCDGQCGKTAGYCPQRRQTNGTIGATKSAAGNRVVGLPDELVALLRDHRRQQLEERIHAGSLWDEGGWVFTTLLGRPIAPNSDYHAWRALLERAGVRHARLHDARHTAATVLLVLGVPERTVMSIMGWSSTSMAGATNTSRIRSGERSPREWEGCSLAGTSSRTEARPRASITRRAAG